ncbi:MAG TPA: hypothetical protein VK843_02085 [Planctomycetota bacterium]|nr:hypothetical protein [Planctomycetota bacterium]
MDSRKANAIAAGIATALGLLFAWDRFLAEVPISSPGLRPGMVPSLIVVAALSALAGLHGWAYLRFHSAPRLALAITSMSWLLIATVAIFFGAAAPAVACAVTAAIMISRQAQWHRQIPFLARYSPQALYLSTPLFRLAAWTHVAAAIAFCWAFMPDVTEQADRVAIHWNTGGALSVACEIDDPSSRAQFLALCSRQGWNDRVPLDPTLGAGVIAQGNRVWTWLPTEAGLLPLGWRVEHGAWKLDSVGEPRAQ